MIYENILLRANVYIFSIMDKGMREEIIAQ